MTPLRITFAGSGEFGAPTLQALLDAGHQIVRVYTQPDRPAGRGRKLTPTPIGEFATRHGLPLVLNDLAEGRASESEQDNALATMAPKLSREFARLDWARSADELARKIRGLYPWPGCRVRVLNRSGGELGRITLVRARPAAAQ